MLITIFWCLSQYSDADHNILMLITTRLIKKRVQEDSVDAFPCCSEDPDDVGNGVFGWLIIIVIVCFCNWSLILLFIVIAIIILAKECLGITGARRKLLKQKWFKVVMSTFDINMRLPEIINDVKESSISISLSKAPVKLWKSYLISKKMFGSIVFLAMLVLVYSASL